MTERADYEAMVEDVEWGLLPDRTGIALHALLTRLSSGEAVVVPGDAYQMWRKAADAWKFVASKRTNHAVLVTSDAFRAAIDAVPTPPPPVATGPSEAALERALAAYDDNLSAQEREAKWEGDFVVNDRNPMRAALIAAGPPMPRGGGSGG